MSQDQVSQFLDVPTLLDCSRPARGASGMRLVQALGLCVAIAIVGTYFSTRGEDAADAVNVVSLFVMLVLFGAGMAITISIARRMRAEQAALQALDELVRLRRWHEAAMLAAQLLGSPMRSEGARVQALIFLSAILARYDRSEDAIAVHDYLLQNVALDGATAHGLGLGRAMSMLREDHLFDADRAINELRRQANRAGRAMADSAGVESESEAGPQEHVRAQSVSAGLALVEIYRDVKTGHPAEAIELFDATLDAMRDQLGHRVADGYVLVAKAYDLLGRTGEAAAMYGRATLLAPAVELHRRYPETASLATKYLPTLPPVLATTEVAA